MSTVSVSQTATANVIMTRLLNAPRELVWKAWTEPEHLKRWWGPHHFTNPVCELDLRPGGALLIVMRGPDGVDHPMTGVFEEIVPIERLVFLSQVAGPTGDALLESRTTVTLGDWDGKTNLTVEANAVGFVAQAVQMLAGMEPGWMQSLERLEEALKKGAIAAKNDTVETARTRFLQAKEQLCRALETTPDDRLNYSPSPSARTPLQVFAHAANAVRGIHELLEGKPLPGATPAEADQIFREAEAKPQTRQEVLDTLKANSDAYLACLDALTPEQLDSPVTLPFSGGATAPLSVALTFATDHTIWHIAQINYIQTLYGDRDWH